MSCLSPSGDNSSTSRVRQRFGRRAHAVLDRTHKIHRYMTISTTPSQGNRVIVAIGSYDERVTNEWR